MKNQEQTISDLVHAAKHQDQHAFRQLLDLHWNELYGFMIKRTENENDAEDLCLQAFSKAFDKIETYNDEFTFSTWLILLSITSEGLPPNWISVPLPALFVAIVTAKGFPA